MVLNQGQSAAGDAGSKGQILENQPQKNKKIRTETGIDWISQLPNSLIVQILSLMHITDACRTTILSKRWQYLWTSIDNVIFHSWKTNWSSSLKVDKFISFTDNIAKSSMQQLIDSSVGALGMQILFSKYLRNDVEIENTSNGTRETKVDMGKAETQPRHVWAALALGVCSKIMDGRLRQGIGAEQYQNRPRLGAMPALGVQQLTKSNGTCSAHAKAVGVFLFVTTFTHV
uniref:F-box/LRR-repeat protein At5g02910-like n=1 Tax=Nicotiana sylvestris TaxID=4096 RepID=A0A1U7YCI9_NICSY|nr:PREDICTED: F-box/LRR-repeat protein At5g02910-like [Nicotiana sylvestris]